MFASGPSTLQIGITFDALDTLFPLVAVVYNVSANSVYQHDRSAIADASDSKVSNLGFLW